MGNEWVVFSSVMHYASIRASARSATMPHPEVNASESHAIWKIVPHGKIGEYDRHRKSALSFRGGGAVVLYNKARRRAEEGHGPWAWIEWGWKGELYIHVHRWMGWMVDEKGNFISMDD